MNRTKIISTAILVCTLFAITSCTRANAGIHSPGTELLVVAATVSAAPQKYSDGRPAATLRMDAKDHGIVLQYGDGPGKCDMLGARDVWVFEDSGTYYMHYDAAGPKGWLCSLAVSKDLLTWEKKGPVLDFGKPGEDDSKSASYGVTYYDGREWHMFYLGTPNTSPEPDLVPSFPYLTMKAKAPSPAGPWIKQKNIVPFRTKPGTYYSLTASPGHVIKNAGEYLQFFSSTTRKPGNPCVQRTLGIARTKDLDGKWTVNPNPMVPIEEQIENSTLYYEKSNKTWFLFTNHIGIDKGEYTDAIWVYWSKNLNKWDPKNKAVVLDGQNCTWSKKCIGLPSVVQIGKRLAVFYDAPGGDSTSHMKRNVGLAWLDLPLSVPKIDVSAAESIKVTDLRCEYLVNPLGIDVDKPRLSWVCQSAERGSLFVVFGKAVKSVKGTGIANFAEQTEIGELTGPWTVKFDPKWGGPESLVFEKLDDWTQRTEPGIKFYSDKATYYKTFDLPETVKGTKKRLYLDLKRVKNVVHVRLNGKDLGVVWTAPWQVDITDAVKATGNKLEIDVINLWPNRLIGDAPLAPEERLTKTNVQQFSVADIKPFLPVFLARLHYARKAF